MHYFTRSETAELRPFFGLECGSADSQTQLRKIDTPRSIFHSPPWDDPSTSLGTNGGDHPKNNFYRHSR